MAIFMTPTSRAERFADSLTLAPEPATGLLLLLPTAVLAMLRNT
jgi:hypothetical protein